MKERKKFMIISVLSIAIIIIFFKGFILKSMKADLLQNNSLQIRTRTELPYDIQKNSYDFSKDELDKENVELEYDLVNGRLKQISGRFSRQLVLNENDALSVLISVRGLFKIQSFEYCLELHDNSSDETETYILRQLWNGISVDDGVFSIVTSKTGEIKLIRGVYIDNIKIAENLDNAISAEECIQLYPELEKMKSGELCIIKTKEKYEVAWKFMPNNMGSIYYINAMDGSLIKKVKNYITF